MTKIASKAQIGGILVMAGIQGLIMFSPKEIYTSEDGIYCAEVEYYNPKTGTESTYTLPVEIEDGLLYKIYFPNGGWLDETHFEPEYVDDGKVKFTTHDGKVYKVSTEYYGECE